MTSSKLFFDQQDHELLQMVNFILERGTREDRNAQLFSPELHPHGIKELAVSRELRIAYSVINLLHSLEAGEATDRILALRSLHDEVLYTVASTFRHNTGRVLIQIMKDLVRAYGNPERQITLAHDFRKAATGRRRVVRKMLRRYHLLEMPEEWDQLTFDNHVHDANTKGRKTPTHLIMDAWIKGIRSLTVIYYNFVEPRAVQELMQAAEIMNINTRIGVEFRATYRGKYIEFIWEPIGMDDSEAMTSFLAEEGMRQLMHDGRSASAYRAQYVFAMLAQYNQTHRHEIGREFGIELPEICEKEFLLFVGTGQPSLLHLAELAYKAMLPRLATRLPELRNSYATGTPEEKETIAALVERMQDLHPEAIMETWFSSQKNPSLPDPDLPHDDPDMPEILRIKPCELLDRLTATRSLCRITLTLSGLRTEDVLELIYDCEGKITHLELFNLKDYAAGKMPYCQSINALQFAINQGSAIALKRLIRGIIHDYGLSTALDAEERCIHMTEILRNIPKLQSFYKRVPLKTRVGSDSTSRSYRLHGMGFAFIETLPDSAQKSIHDPCDNFRQVIPLHSDIDSRYCYSPPVHHQHDTIHSLLARLVRALPGFRYFGYSREHSWAVRTATTKYCDEDGSIATLGGIQREPTEIFTLEKQKTVVDRPGIPYLNTRLANFLKVAFGFALAMSAFSVTQQWWVLIWFGAPIWFSITGLRNILQSVLGGGGFHRTPLLKWNDYVSWSRICDSLLFTGISVPLLELFLRWWLLGHVFSLTAASNPFLFYTIISSANGLYVASHNIFRGLPKEAAIGNLFRSVLSIPVALLYNHILIVIVAFSGNEYYLPLLVAGSAIVSKAASDTMAGIIEGIADQNNNLRMRNWDYRYKLQQLFACFGRLEVLLPDEDVADLFQNPKESFQPNTEMAELGKSILIHSLDLMYFWMYQPRARTMLTRTVRSMTQDERTIFALSQLVLNRVKSVSQLFVDGIVGKNFSRPLAFFLDRHAEYLKDMSRLTKVPLEIPQYKV